MSPAGICSLKDSFEMLGTMTSVWRTSAIIVAVLLTITQVMSLPLCPNKTCILKASKEFLEEENSRGIGYDVSLNEKEQKIDSDILKPLKTAQLELKTKFNYLNLRNNELFNFIRDVPKGGDLHIHDISMVDIRWVVKELTYLPNLYCCTTNGGEMVRFRFSKKTPHKENYCDANFLSVEKERKKVGPEKFDEMLYDKMTMTGDKTYYEDESWDTFISKLDPILDLVYTERGFRPYFRQALTEFHKDNGLYLEVRTLLLPILCDNGTTLDREITLQQYMEVTEEFKEENPDFIGAKFIHISVRNFPVDVIETDLRLAVALRQKYPDYLLGFDLVGYENGGAPLKDLLDVLLIPSLEGIDLPYFFHAGETNQLGSDTDENILFAVLLNTTRIGHGLALVKHPKMMELVEGRRIPLEIAPISNEVLSLVADQRNHPAVILFSRNMPVVICSDDPAPWKTSGLSYDYFAAFTYFTKANDGLSALKEISRNGIRYSGMNEEEKVKAMEIWQRRWDQFVDDKSLGYTQSAVDNTHTEL